MEEEDLSSASQIEETLPGPIEDDNKATDKSIQCLLKPLVANKGVAARRMGSSKGCQFKVKTRDIGCQCEIIKAPVNEYDNMDTDSDSDPEQYMEETDPEWTPEYQINDSEDETSIESDTEVEEVDEILRSDISPESERKFIVFESCLVALLSVCVICSLPCKVVLQYAKGSFAVIQQLCSKGHSRTWATQPMHGTLPQGNLQLAAGILFSGSSPVKVINMLKHINVLSIVYRTYNLIQSHYLLPAIFHVWKSEQEMLLTNLQSSSKKLTLGGDGRCDSPGHSAKYGSYSVLDLDINKVIEMELVQSNEVSSSNAMELEGLKRCLANLDKYDLEIKSLTTDRHRGVQKYLRESRPSIIHYYDVWHLAKKIYRKLLALAKKSGYLVLKGWAKAISNHLYWCASSSQGNQELVREKWQSIGNHVANIHEGHGALFPRCLHGDIDDRDWVVQGSRAHKGLLLILNNKVLLKDVGKLSPSGQTSSVESYHSVLCFFAPKMVHYFFPTMKARLILATLHFNENSDRAQARNQRGELLWSISYPKYKEGGTVKEVKVAASFEYVKKLNKMVQKLRGQFPSYKKAKELSEKFCTDKPSPLTANVQKQNKGELVASHVTRFPNK